MIGFGEPEAMTCSRANCRETAVWRIEWRNPKIHSEDRVKVWLACSGHVDYLREFLAAREFPLRVVAVSDAVPTDAVPTDAVPTDAVPTDAVPTDAGSATGGAAS